LKAEKKAAILFGSEQSRVIEDLVGSKLNLSNCMCLTIFPQNRKQYHAEHVHDDLTQTFKRKSRFFG